MELNPESAKLGFRGRNSEVARDAPFQKVPSPLSSALVKPPLGSASLSITLSLSVTSALILICHMWNSKKAQAAAPAAHEITEDAGSSASTQKSPGGATTPKSQGSFKTSSWLPTKFGMRPSSQPKETRFRFPGPKAPAFTRPLLTTLIVLPDWRALRLKGASSRIPPHPQEASPAQQPRCPQVCTGPAFILRLVPLEEADPWWQLQTRALYMSLAL
eukprot:3798332-Rhodomonas_salina.1